jgi:hypothetical protein
MYSILATEIIEDLQSALEELQAISDDLTMTPGAKEAEKDD